LTKKGLKEMKRPSIRRRPAAPFFFGVNGVVVKAHGNSTPEAFKNAMEVAYRLSEAKSSKLKEGFKA
jgi:glycerol-3-phosphate acyltransferase PlsX